MHNQSVYWWVLWNFLPMIQGWMTLIIKSREKSKKLYNYISVQKRLKPKVCLSPWSRNGSASRARLPYTHQHCSHFAKLLMITVWFAFTSTDRILEYIQTSKQIKKSVGYICDSLWGYTVFWAEPVASTIGHHLKLVYTVAWILLGRVTNCWDEFWSFFRIMRNKQAWGPKSDLLGSDLF